MVYGDLEAYSCECYAWLVDVQVRSSLLDGMPDGAAHPVGKLAGLDKKLSKSLDQEVQVGSSPQELSMSPVGPLSDSARCVCNAAAPHEARRQPTSPYAPAAPAEGPCAAAAHMPGHAVPSSGTRVCQRMLNVRGNGCSF